MQLGQKGEIPTFPGLEIHRRRLQLRRRFRIVEPSRHTCGKRLGPRQIESATIRAREFFALDDGASERWEAVFGFERGVVVTRSTEVKEEKIVSRDWEPY